MKGTRKRKHEGIAYQNKDITSKVFAEHFKGKTFQVYGLDIPEITTVLPTNIPTVKANELRLDNLFELADGTIAIVDYESEYRKEDKIKYLNYLSGVANRYLKEKRDCPLLRMIVIYTGDISRKQVSGEYNIGAVKVTLEPAFLSELDSGGIFRRLKEKVARKETLDDKDLMECIILPLSYQKKEEKEEKIREVVKLATQIQDRGQQLFVLAGILTFTDKLIDRETANKIRREIEMTQVERIFEEEKLQALAELEKRVRQEMIKAKKEKRKMIAELKEKNRKEVAEQKEKNRKELAEVEEKNRKELAEVEEKNRKKLAEVEEKNRKKLAEEKEKNREELAKAEEENRQAVRASVFKMIRRNYSSEEIAFIFSDFSLDDIETMRQEIAQAE